MVNHIPHLTLKDPLTPLSLADWIENCENEFDSILNNPNIPDKSKIAFAGSAILASEPAVESLRKWWKGNSRALKGGTWEEFTEKLQAEAFGRHQRFDALDALYSIQQDGKSINVYLEKFKAVVETLRLVDDSAVEPQHTKQFLLFRADPPIRARVRELPGFNINEISMTQLEGLLREVEHPLVEEQNNQHSASKHWSKSELFGLYATGASFSDFDFDVGDAPMPALTTCLASITLHKQGRYPYFGGYTHQIVAKADATSELFCQGSNAVEDQAKLVLNANEYITRVELKCNASLIMWVRVVTNQGNQGRSITLGQELGTKASKVFSAPEGQRIIGFHGRIYPSSPNLIGALGVIFAPT